jgi:hypothetical protein
MQLAGIYISLVLNVFYLAQYVTTRLVSSMIGDLIFIPWYENSPIDIDS